MDAKQQKRMERYEAKVAASTAELIEAGLSPEIAAEKARKMVQRPGASVEGTLGFAAKGTVIHVVFDLSEAVGALTESGKNTIVGRTTGGMLPVIVDGKPITLNGKMVQFAGGLYVDEQGAEDTKPGKPTQSSAVPAVHGRVKGGKGGGKGTVASAPASAPQTASQTPQGASQTAPETSSAPVTSPAASA